jgi:hypothetical protein
MNDVILIVVLAIPFVALGAIVAGLVVRIGRETSRRRT